MRYDRQFGVVVVLVVLLQGIEGGVVIDRRLVRRMVIVGEEIDEIQVFVQSGYIVTFVDVLDAGRHRQREQKSRPSGLRSFPLELLPQFLRDTNQ